MKKHLFFFLILFTACNHSHIAINQSIETISVDMNKASIVDLSIPFKEITYTLLSDSDSFLIGDVDRMKIAGNKLYIITSKRLLSFDASNGNPLLSLQRLGNASGEYSSLYDMWIDPVRQEIELLDMNGKKIQTYNNQGILLKEMKIPFMSFAFCKYNEHDYLFYNNNLESDATDCQLIHYNADKNAIEETFFPINKQLANYFFVVEANNFNINTNGYSFFSCPSNTLYTITKDWQAMPEYTINFGKNQPPKDFFDKNYADIADFAIQAERNDYIYFINNLTENNTHIIFSFKRGKENYWAIYNKEKAELTTGQEIHTGIHTPDIPLKIEYYNTAFALTDQAFYFLIQPFQFIELLEKYKQEIEDKKFSDFISKHSSIHKIYHSKNFNEQSNPILVTCKFRNNEAQ